VAETDPFKGEPLAESLKDSRALKFNLQGSGASHAAYVITGQTFVVYYIGTRKKRLRRDCSVFEAGLPRTLTHASS
jgi:hypothetical protein